MPAEYLPIVRICYVITDLNTGGVPLHLLGLATHMAGTGAAVCVATLAPPGPVSEMLERAGVRTEACDALGPWDLRAIVRLGRLIDRFQPDVVHALLFHANMASRLACFAHGFPSSRLICEIQTVEIERRWHLMLDRFTQRLCGYIVGNSRSVVEHLEEAAGILPGRLRLIEGGVDIERIADGQPIPQTEFGCEQNVPVVMWVGRLDPIKGLDVLLEAIAQLKGHQAVQVALVGDGPMRDGLEARARNLEIEGMVHWLGMRSDVPSLLHSADVFAFPSRTEGLPNALLEAMAAGLPIVTTDAPGCRDLIQDGVTGLVAPVGDSTAMAAAIRRLLADRSLATALGGRAKERARLHFGREACCERYKALYRDLLSS